MGVLPGDHGVCTYSPVGYEVRRVVVSAYSKVFEYFQEMILKYSQGVVLK